MEVSKAEIGERIRAAIKGAKLTLKQVGDAVGVTEGAISGYISGRTEPSAKGYATIAEVTGVSIDWLITGKGEMKPGPPIMMIAEGNGDFYAAGTHDGKKVFVSYSADETEMLSLVQGIDDFREKCDLKEVMETFLKLPRSKQKRALAEMHADLESLPKAE